MSERRGSDWRTVLLVLGATGGAMLSFLAALLIMAYAALGLTALQLVESQRSTLDMVVIASALIVIGMAFVPAAYYGIQRLIGRGVLAAVPRLLRVWEGILLVAIWLAAGVAAGHLTGNQIAKWAAPLLYVLAIGVPPFFFARLATGGLQPGSRERFWGALASGIGLGVGPAIIAELSLAVLGLIGVAVYLAVHPEQVSALQSLADQLRDSANADQILAFAAPWLTKPLVIIAALVVFSVISPLIEETTKSLTTWAVYDRLSSPAQGFAIGAMSGAAFGLVESLLASSTPDANWTMTLLVRGASSMMHVMSASLTGWGIALFRTRKSFGALIGLYALALSLHAAWNASVVAITVGSVRAVVAAGGHDPIGLGFIAIGAAILTGLCVAIPLGMATLNWRFRKKAVSVPAAGPESWDRPRGIDESHEDMGTISSGIPPELHDHTVAGDPGQEESDPPSSSAPLS